MSESDHVTAALSSTETWPFEIRAISTFRKVWTHIIALLKGDLKIGLRKAVD